ncbi:single-stranded DNA-binding protein [Pontiellaceae bacterium B12227]|nr:single-stranded DNA-binding protein [Pontiellaceae bacterium B12227]
MKSFNKVILVGNVATDVEFKTLKSGTKVADFRLAMNERYKDKDGEDHESKVYVTIETWSGLAETCDKYLTVGRAVLVEGRLKMDEWENGEGEKRSRLLVTAETVNFLDKPKD